MKKNLKELVFAILVIAFPLFTNQSLKAQDFLSENFNSLTPDGPMQTGWDNQTLGVATSQWTVKQPFTYSGVQISMLNTNFVVANGDIGGDGSVTNSILSTPVVNTAAANGLMLEFSQFYRDYIGTTTDSAIVEVYNGTKWIRVQAADTNIGTGAAPVRTKINISAYKNPQMKVRFRLVGVWPWYWAIDFVRIYEIPGNDAGISAIISPTGSCGLGPSTQIKVKISNYGGLAQTSIPVFYRVNNGPIVNETYNGNIASSGSQVFTFNTPANFSASGTYKITAWTKLSSDNAPDNDSTRISFEKFGNSLSTVTFQGFNGNNVSVLYPGWTVFRGWPPAIAGGAWRASNTAQTNFFGSTTASINLSGSLKKDWIMSPEFTAGGNTGLAFKAAVTAFQSTQSAVMGSDDSLKIYVSTNCGASWQIIGFISRGNNLPNQLKQFIIPLTSFNGQGIRIGFFGTEGTIDDPEDYDIHIDDIEIRNVPAKDITLSSITGPQSGCSSSTPLLGVLIKNVGYEPQSGFQVCYSIDGATPACLPYPGTLQSNQEATINFPAATASLSNPGNYKITVFSKLVGDGNISNDSVKNYSYQNIPLVNTFPYFQSFEVNNGGWLPGGVSPSWELGSPSKTVIQGAADGSKAYVTGGIGTGSYNNNENSFVLGPCMDFTNLPNPVFEMRAWWHCEALNDGAVLQSSIDGGITWTVVGQLNAITNWYNTTGISGFPPTIPNPKNGWSGGISGLGGSDGWVLVRSRMLGLGGKPNVKLRIFFGSNANINGDGFAFDAIRISNGPRKDLAIASLESPLPEGCGLNENTKIRVRVQNQGLDTVYSINYTYRIENGTPVSEQKSDTILPQAFSSYEFNASANLSGTLNYNIYCWAKVDGDTYTPNDSLKQKTRRNGLFLDTLNFTGFNGSNIGSLFFGWKMGTGFPKPSNPASQWRAPQAAQVSYVTSKSVRLNMFGTSRNDWIYSPGYEIAPNSFLNFEVATTKKGDIVNDPNGGFNGTDDKLRILISTDCGNTWNEISSFGSADDISNQFKQFKVNFFAYANTEIRFAFRATSGPVANPNDYDLFIRNIYFQSLPPDDIGVARIVSPDISCGLTANNPVKIEIRNYGLNSVSNFPVSLKVNNGPVLISNYQGTLASGQAAEFTFPQTIDLSLSVPYNIQVGTLLATDITPQNNNKNVLLSTVVAPFSPISLIGYNGNNLSTILSGWNEAKGNNTLSQNSAWTNGFLGGDNAFKIKLAGGSKNDWIISPGIKINPGNVLEFNAAQFVVNGTDAAVFAGEDSINVMASTDCGSSWTSLFKLELNTNPPLTNSTQAYSISLNQFANQEIRLGFRAKDGTRSIDSSDVYINGIQVKSTLTQDAGPIEFTFSPQLSSNSFLKDSVYSVSVKVKNVGSLPISNVPVSLSFQNGQTFNQVISGPVLNGQTQLVYMGNFTPNALANNQLAYVLTSLAGDQAISNDTLKFIYNVSELTNVDNISKREDWRVFPNPANAEVSIIPPAGFDQNIIADLYNYLGQLVQSSNLKKDKYAAIKMLLRDFPEGIYHLRLYSENRSSSQIIQLKIKH